jgi:hypothetical protein
MSEPTGGPDPLAPRVEVEGGGGVLRLVVTGHGQRIVVELEGDAAQNLADEVLEVVEGPVQSRGAGSLGDRVHGTAPRARLEGRHPSTVGLLRWFEYAHLPPHLAAISRRFHDLAYGLVGALPDDPELTVALRKLLEGKDAAVRCAIGLDGAGPEFGGTPRPHYTDR